MRSSYHDSQHYPSFPDANLVHVGNGNLQERLCKVWVGNGSYKKKNKLTPQLTHHPHDDEIITNSKHVMPSQSWFKSATLLSKRCHLDQ